MYTEIEMATKTITIDVDAYGRLRRLKRDNESFSEVLKRVLPRRVDLDQLFADLDQAQPSKSFFSGIDRQLQNRRRSARRSR